MKRFLLFCVCICAAAAANAQDTIVMRNADEVKAKVTAVTPNEISYVKWENPNGPTYTIYKSDVFYIKYENGTKDVFSDMTRPAGRNANNYCSAPQQDYVRRPANDNIKLQSYIYAGTVFMSDIAGPTLDVSLGMRVFDYAYIGVETGLHTFMESVILKYPDGTQEYDTAVVGYVPIGANLKGYIPTRGKVYPYINCSLGGFIGAINFGGLNGFYCQVGAGVDIKRFSIGVGYSGLVKYGISSDCGYVKLGIRLGKR